MLKINDPLYRWVVSTLIFLVIPLSFLDILFADYWNSFEVRWINCLLYYAVIIFVILSPSVRSLLKFLGFDYTILIALALGVTLLLLGNLRHLEPIFPLAWLAAFFLALAARRKKI